MSHKGRCFRQRRETIRRKAEQAERRAAGETIPSQYGKVTTPHRNRPNFSIMNPLAALANVFSYSTER